VRPEYHLTGTNVLADINDFASVLDIAISQRDIAVIALTVQSVNDLLQDLADHYPDSLGREPSPGAKERTLARATIAALTETLHRVALDAEAKRFDQAAGDYLNYRRLTAAAAPLALQNAEAWSLFDPTLHAAHQALLRRTMPAQTAAR
jgi:hypothetical protein